MAACNSGFFVRYFFQRRLWPANVSDRFLHDDTGRREFIGNEAYATDEPAGMQRLHQSIKKPKTCRRIGRRRIFPTLR